MNGAFSLFRWRNAAMPESMNRIGNEGSTDTGGGRPWRLAAIWCAILAVTFFSTYNLSNWITAQRTDVGVYVFGWERHIPFLAWTIVPYWSIDLLYGISLALCRSRQELRRHVRRLFCAQAICVAGFLLCPLRFSFERPVAEGLFGTMFDILMGFDKPFNQAPSLHICLLVILWRHYARHVPGGLARAIMHGWFALIGLSVLTTYQHHFVDVVAGAWAGMLCLFLVPDVPAGWNWLRWKADLRRCRLAAYYACGASCGLLLTWISVPAWLDWLWAWTAGALALVAALYLFGSGTHFGKQDGRLPWWVWGLLAPYLLAARLNAWLWTRKLAAHVAIVDGIHLGRLPRHRSELDGTGISRVVDVCAELPLPGERLTRHEIPMLDLVTAEARQLHEAARAIEAARQHGPVLVCCALGFSRSAAALIAWLMAYRGATLAEARAQVADARPQIALHAGMLAALQSMALEVAKDSSPQ